MSTDGVQPDRDADEDVIQFLVARVNSLEDRVDDLQQQVDQDTDAITAEVMDRFESKLAAERHQRETALKDEQITRTQAISSLKSTVEDEIEDVRDDLRDEQKTRSRADARTQQRVTHLADTIGTEIDDDAIADDDKLVTLVREGPRAVVADPYPVHRRVQQVLTHLEEWGQYVSDGNGTRVVLTSTTLCPYLEAHANEQFASSQLKRIFEKLVALAGDSPRRVRQDKTNDGAHRVTIWHPQAIISAAEAQR
ncbi:hypothetical protein [Haloarcula nitratireducens]|uniref:Uncharacterized protein n=1 Tax=Haloarcula nitratireducens TaxID=2487749 RepID=A0AAW4PFA9_9EURY|nr:hypothetical protein [Halomicroarcula nitratireducens]MBX0296655.1 hypothetical protein [Halomicroarcula nitratireducens]